MHLNIEKHIVINMKTNKSSSEKIKLNPHLGHIVSFATCKKSKSWALPEGSYRAVFEGSELSNGKDIFHFRITSLEDEIYEFWARNCYRFGDRDKMRDHLLSWLGEEEFRALATMGNTLHFKELYGREADIVIKHLTYMKASEPLRIIDHMAPPGTLVPDSVVDAELVGKAELEEYFNQNIDFAKLAELDEFEIDKVI